MDPSDKYKDLDVDKVTDRMLLARIQNECSILKDPELWQKVHDRREKIEKEEREDWAFAQEKDSMRAYWSHFRRWPKGLHASEARDRFKRRLFWNPPKERPKPGLVQQIVEEIVSLVVGGAILGVVTLAIFGAMYLVFGGEPRLAGIASIVILVLILRYGYKGSFGETALGVLFCFISALLLLGAWSYLAG